MQALAPYGPKEPVPSGLLSDPGFHRAETPWPVVVASPSSRSRASALFT